MGPLPVNMDLASTYFIRGSNFPTPTHHPAPELLVDYVAGALSPAAALLIELHLAFCTGCRRSLDVLLAAGGALMDALPPARLPADLFNRTLQALGGMEPASTLSDPTPVPAFAAGWPRVLRDRVVEQGYADWRKMPGGFRAITIPFPKSEGRVIVLKAPGGRGPFRHTHAKDEWTVVLEGGFTDELGTYTAGDFVCAGRDIEHTVIADDGGCVCTLLMRAAPVYTTWPGKLMQRFMKV